MDMVAWLAVYLLRLLAWAAAVALLIAAISAVQYVGRWPLDGFCWKFTDHFTVWLDDDDDEMATSRGSWEQEKERESQLVRFWLSLVVAECVCLCMWVCLCGQTQIQLNINVSKLAKILL